MLKKKRVIPLVIILTLTLASCTPSTPDNNSNDQGTEENNGYDQNNPNQGTNNINAAYENIEVVPGEVFHTFQKKYPDAKIKKLELDLEHGSYIYEVEGYDNVKEYELKISSVDGSILKEEQDDENNNDREGEITLEDVNKISNLIDRTLEDAGDSYQISEWTLKSKNDQTMFKIEVINGVNHDIEYKYNVNSEELIEKDW